MKAKTTDQKRDGFTIIEVLIVLTIAGLILLIVFMAVPALQRNSRNTQRRQDVASLLSAVSDYQSNHAGQLPNTSGQFNGGNQFASTYPNLGYYTTPPNVQWSYSGTARIGGVPTPPNGVDNVTLYNYLKCADATTATFSNATQRSVVALFNVEGSSGAVAQCIES